MDCIVEAIAKGSVDAYPDVCFFIRRAHGPSWNLDVDGSRVEVYGFAGDWIRQCIPKSTAFMVFQVFHINGLQGYDSDTLSSARQNIHKLPKIKRFRAQAVLRRGHGRSLRSDFQPSSTFAPPTCIVFSCPLSFPGGPSIHFALRDIDSANSNVDKDRSFARLVTFPLSSSLAVILVSCIEDVSNL